VLNLIKTFLFYFILIGIVANIVIAVPIMGIVILFLGLCLG